MDLHSGLTTQANICGVGLVEQGRIVNCEISTGNNQRTDSKRRHWCLEVDTHGGIGGPNRTRAPSSHYQGRGCEWSLENKYGS